MTAKNIQRDEQILTHLGLYRLSFRVAIAALFFGGGSPGNVLQRLRMEGRIISRGGLRNRVRYYQLSPTEAAARGVPLVRSRPPKPQAFYSHQATLWYCSVVIGGPNRRRLEPEELVTLFGPRIPKGPHVFESGPEPKVIRVIAVAPQTPARTAVRALRKRIRRLSRIPDLDVWIRKRHYTFVLVTDSEPKRARLAQLVNKHGITDRTETRTAYAPREWTSGTLLPSSERRPRAQ